MATRLADRLEEARRRRFVGRGAELGELRSALASTTLPFQVLHVFGPGGVGKTALLREFVWIARQLRARAVYLDARNVEPSPEDFVAALRAGLEIGPSESPIECLAASDRRHVVLIDTYELLGALDGWLREVFLPQLPENTLVVLADRNPPSPAWRSDPGWQDLVRILPLRNLSPDEGRAYLAKREIPVEQLRAVLDFTHGHPLALSLIADVFAQRPNVRFEPDAAPDVVKALLERFIQKVPGPAHRAALEACALVRLTTEPLLAEMLGMLDAHDLFEWLRELSFVESGHLGIFPHDLAREALDADLRWRNPDWYAELHRRARAYYTARFQQLGGHDQQRILLDLIYLHRHNAVVRACFEWQESGVSPEIVRPGDIPAILAMVASHEGVESARHAERWLGRQPESALVFREAEGRLSGFVMLLALHRATSEDLRADPSAGAAERYLAQHAPLRPGESATLFRFWMARDTYQAVSTIQSHIFVAMVRHYLTTPGLAFTFIPCAEPDFWAPVFSYADLARLPEADFEIGGRRYGVYGHDWRALPPLAWLALLAERETGASPSGPTPSPPAEPLVVLSRPEFASAVHDAFRGLSRPDALHANPLLRSRLLVEGAGTGTTPSKRVAALRRLLEETSESLLASPRDAKLHRALYHTYFRPAATQEHAAEVLGLPFSTYRRHLKTGVDRVVEILWQREVGGSHE